ncbi:LacI family DNA-binding transcriptional regulator [Streptomyces sp. Je 1-369]|uniref:LacI family DNA-binding transcriptional regulator n=1 Tax=Streptomyces sp. Je 1-369 TaxID=2966192 RepID=UPI002285BE9E|nr:LacI family DNA-binding transcriptional regulator [Streptomyces sp. Je 1-369]WAL98454.1 LacI family transcriptional regulator [Streptomyces sp. Je 1-369]
MCRVPGPTLADIARAAEVSHALNGTGRVGDATRRRVRETATRLGYGTPGPPRTRTLGIAVTTFPAAWNYTDIAYFSRAVTAATSAAHARGYALITLPADRAADDAWHHLAVDGMLIMDSPRGDPMVRALRARGIPLVFDGAPGDPRPGDHWVDNDHESTVREVLDHLSASGARRVALQSGSGDEHYARAVTAAYERWCADHSTPPLVIPFDETDDEGHAFDPLLQDGEDGEGRVDAVYAAYDPGGRQLLAAAARHGLRVPDDLRVVCASEDPAYAETTPPVTTVTLAPDQMAHAAVAVLVALIEDDGTAPRGPVSIPAGLIVRASSATRPAQPA